MASVSPRPFDDDQPATGGRLDRTSPTPPRADAMAGMILLWAGPVLAFVLACALIR